MVQAYSLDPNTQQSLNLCTSHHDVLTVPQVPETHTKKIIDYIRVISKRIYVCEESGCLSTEKVEYL
jgi:hypothetical protein